MTPTTRAKGPPAPAGAITLDAFFDHLRGANPFLVDRVVRPSAADADADTVHQAEFRQLVELARVAGEQHVGVGALLWGEAGVGKSHLLSRLARWAAHGKQASFVYLQNLQADAEHLPRS